MALLYVMGVQLIKTIAFRSFIIDQLAASPLVGMADIAAQLTAEMKRLLDGKRLWDFAKDRIQAVQPLVDYRKVSHDKSTKKADIWSYQILLADKALGEAGGDLPDCSPAAVEKIARQTLRTTAIKAYDTPIPSGLSDSTEGMSTQKSQQNQNGGRNNNPSAGSKKGSRKRQRKENKPSDARDAKRQKTDPNAILPPYKTNDKGAFLNACRKLRLEHGEFRRWGKMKNLLGMWYAVPWSRLRLTPKESYDENDKHVKLLTKLIPQFPIIPHPSHSLDEDNYPFLLFFPHPMFYTTWLLLF